MTGWQILLPALVLTALMAVPHTYLGLHVLARGIIFVDLALAQIAALGVAAAFLLWGEAHGHEARLFAFAAALIAALGFTLLRKIAGQTTREVVIGCVYVVAAALSVVLLSESTQGMEELKHMLNGNILWVQWAEVGEIALVYAAVMALFMIFHRRFHALSFVPGVAGRAQFVWEFLFFAAFALVITLGVILAGVLLVFAFLIIPAFSATLISHRFSRQLVVGSVLGIAGAVLGLWLSLLFDLPTGATVVSAFGLLPLLAWPVGAIVRRA